VPFVQEFSRRVCSRIKAILGGEVARTLQEV
jgi:hypothetical protein